MLHILTGRAGCGKTTSLLRRMAKNGAARPQILLVPEQASFETERRFCQENGDGGNLYGEVLSFTRLENRVLSLCGGKADPVLDEGGRLLVLYAALKSVSGNLSVYAMPSRKPEFLNSLLSTLDELKSCCVTSATLLQAGEETEGLDGQKLRDLGLIFGAYEAITARGPLDPKDRLTRLAEKLAGFPFFRDKDVYLDGFTDFTPQQGLVLNEILQQAHSVTVSLTSGENEEIFAPAHRTAAWLKRLAQRVGCPVTEETFPPQAHRRTPPLTYLEETLFNPSPLSYDGAWDGSLVFGSLPTPREEVRWTAGEIRTLVREKGLRYRDIALSARTMDRYREQVEQIFAEYEIPVFQSAMTDILQKPIFTLITAAMDAVSNGYLYEDVFRYLKTGLTDLSLEEVDRLENYVLTWNIRGSRWTSAKDWTMHPGGYGKPITEQDEADLAELNRLRLLVIQPLEKLRKAAGATIREQVFALYDFLEATALPQRLTQRTQRLLEQGEPELAKEYSQLWDIFCGALEQCEALLGDMESDFSEFTRLLRLLLSRYTVGSIPASLDRVTAGDAQRLANRSCKVLFLLGADDGSIPNVTPGQGLLTDRDRVLLEGYGLELSPRMEEKLNRENTILYTVCAKPTKALYVTWPLSGEGGGENRPSFLIEALEKCFPQGKADLSPALSPALLRSLAARSRTIRAELQGADWLEETLSRTQRAAGWHRGNLSKEAVRTLYGEKVAMSASRMDQYKSCHFSYFMKFGLKAAERQSAGFHAPEYGSFVHFVLEYVLRAVREKGGIQAVSPEAVRSLAAQGVQVYVQTQLGGMEHQTPRFKYLFRRLQTSVQSVAENVTEELRASDFQPIRFELGFGYGEDKELPPVEVKSGGITLRISGFVDRVDGWVKDGRLYLRVIDYKTGRKSFDLTEIWNGLGLQMLLYLFTLEEKGHRYFGQETVPAGVLYLPAREAVIAGSRTMEETLRQKMVDKALTRKGIVLSDPEVLEAMEHSESGMRFLPLRVSKKTGEISGDALVSAEKLGRLRTHTETILTQICQEIAAGNINADPYWRGPEKNACQYCPFFQACQFEKGTDKRRYLPTVKNEEFWSWLEQQEGGEAHGHSANP